MESNIKVSLFASAVRPVLWPALFKSLEGTIVNYEVVFVGNAEVKEFTIGRMNIDTKMIDVNGEYITTENIKPAQCYEIARRHCTGEVVVWVADDAEFPNNVIGKAYDYWKSQNNEKLILSIQTRETGYKMAAGELFDMKQHCFFGYCPETPLMAPLAMMSRKFLDQLGGIDQRYVCGQYENDIVMRAYADGAKVEIFGDKTCFIDIDHLGKSIAIGESKVEEDFLNRPFATGFQKDRQVLEDSWCRFNQGKLIRIASTGKQLNKGDMHDISNKQLDQFQPYPEEISLTESHSNKGKWQ